MQSDIITGSQIFASFIIDFSVFWSPSRMITLTPGCRYSVRVSPQMANRIVDSARSILNKFIPDIYIYTDHVKGVNSGK